MDLTAFLENLATLGLEAAPWLLFGLIVAGLVKVWFTHGELARILGGRGLRPIVYGALIGAPLPICSCGVLPVAIGLSRGGASRGATASFLVATPETGVDSVALSFGMLGPFMAIARPIAAIFSAIVTGLLMAFLPREETAPPAADSQTSCESSCCCASTSPESATPSPGSPLSRTLEGLRYAFVDIYADIVAWLAVGLLLAAATMTWIPPQALGEMGSGIPAMLAMVALGIPMYICATASTPVAASLLMAGVSPGAAMVFMLAGPATNIATLGVVRKEMGNAAVVLYLVGIIGASIAAGLITDIVAQAMAFDVAVQMSGPGEIVPAWLAMTSAAILLVSAVRPGLSLLKTVFQRPLAST